MFNLGKDITIGYLSWNRNEILEQTLKSHQDNGLYNIIPPENRIIFFQEISNLDRQTADKYNIKVLGNNENIGIMNAFIELVKNCNTKYFIFCENDWLLIENKDVCSKVIQDCIRILNTNGKNIIIRLRNTKNPGVPLYSKPKNVNEWLQGNYHFFPYKLESLTWLDEPNEYYNDGVLEEIIYNFKWYKTTLEHQKWSNNIFIGDTNFLKKNIIPLIKNFSYLNKYNGLEEVLINYNNYYDNSKEFNELIDSYKKTEIVAGIGLFCHKDKIL